MGFEKTDRVARLLKIEHLLYQNKEGCTVKKISEITGVSARTTYRDLQTLEQELKIPIWEDREKRGIIDRYYLPPVLFNRNEAFNIFLAVRLLYNYMHQYNPNVTSALIKLNSILPYPVRDYVNNMIDLMQKQPRDEKFLSIMDILVQAWFTKHQVIIRYRLPGKTEVYESVIEPYILEPSATRNSCWLIGYCPSNKTIQSFKLARIQSAEISPNTCLVSNEYDDLEFFNRYWHLPPTSPDNKHLTTVVLKFSPKAGTVVAESIWHNSQTLEHLSDGSIILTVKVVRTKQLMDWILQWGEGVQVLKPQSLRKELIDIARAILARHACFKTS